MITDEEADINVFLDLSRAKRANQQIRRVNVDFPVWMIESLDKEAARIDVSYQFLRMSGLPNGFSSRRGECPDFLIAARGLLSFRLIFFMGKSSF